MGGKKFCRGERAATEGAHHRKEDGGGESRHCGAEGGKLLAEGGKSDFRFLLLPIMSRPECKGGVFRARRSQFDDPVQELVNVVSDLTHRGQIASLGFDMKNAESGRHADCTQTQAQAAPTQRRAVVEEQSESRQGEQGREHCISGDSGDMFPDVLENH